MASAENYTEQDKNDNAQLVHILEKIFIRKTPMAQTHESNLELFSQ